MLSLIFLMIKAVTQYGNLSFIEIKENKKYIVYFIFIRDALKILFKFYLLPSVRNELIRLLENVFAKLSIADRQSISILPIGLIIHYPAPTKKS